MRPFHRASRSVTTMQRRPVLRALAAAISVPVTIDPGLRNLKMKDGLTADVLTFLCELQNCEWDSDVAHGLRDQDAMTDFLVMTCEDLS